MEREKPTIQGHLVEVQEFGEFGIRPSSTGSIHCAMHESGQRAICAESSGNAACKGLSIVREVDGVIYADCVLIDPSIFRPPAR